MALKPREVDHIANVIHLAIGEHGFSKSHSCSFARGRAKILIKLANSTPDNRRKLQDLADRLPRPTPITPFTHTFAIGELRYRASVGENKPDLVVEIKSKHIPAFRKAWEQRPRPT